MIKNIFSQTSLWLALGLFLIVVFAICNLQCGVIHYNLHDLIQAFFASNVDTVSTITLVQIRLPMVLMAIMAGAGIAISGLLLQRVTQNPLACPSLTGIEYGTAFCVILSYMFIPQISRPSILLIALLGGVLTYLLMRFIVMRTNASAVGITLIGVAFDALYFSAIQAILVAFPYQAQAILYNLNGSLQGATLGDIKLLAPIFLILIAATLLFGKRLDLLDLDELQATALGFSIKKYQLIILALSTLFAIVMTSMTGPLLFFSLIIPHIVKPLARGGAHLILLCAVYGAAFLLIAEFLTQIIMPQTPPPVGLVTLLFASPILIFISRRYFAYDEK